jgi:hypothetical protein
MSNISRGMAGRLLPQRLRKQRWAALPKLSSKGLGCAGLLRHFSTMLSNRQLGSYAGQTTVHFGVPIIVCLGKHENVKTLTRKSVLEDTEHDA